MALTSVAHAQIGWTLDQCRKHWGRESPGTFTTYSFGPKDLVTGIQIDVTLDSQDKVNEVWYLSSGGGRYDNKPSLLDIPGLLAIGRSLGGLRAIQCSTNFAGELDL
jgi:hypothetical protein